ncbi:F0F1 ATP synthase subunit epsilon [Clostridium sp. JNZ J1-5]
MPNLIKFKVITPNKSFYEGDIKELITETVEGERAILPLHSPLIAMLRPAITTIVEGNGEEKKFFSSSGILKVNKGEVTMLCDAADWPEDIDKARAEEAKERAEDRLNKKEGIDEKRAKLALSRAVKRIESLNINNR